VPHLILGAKLLPYIHWAIPGFGYILGYVCLLVAKLTVPFMLVLFADQVAFRVVVVRAEVKSVYASGVSM